MFLAGKSKWEPDWDSSGDSPGIGERLRIEALARRRFAREVHDTTTQHFAGIQLLLADLGHSIADAANKQKLKTLQGAVRDALNEARALSHVWHPPRLSEHNLPRALQQLSQGLADRAGLALEQDILLHCPPVCEVAGGVFYRIAQEALANVVRHAKANTVRVSLSCERGTITLRVCDDGIGIDPGCEAGIGLNSMRERTEESGGVFQICSQPGQTCIIATLPNPDVTPLVLLNDKELRRTGN